MNNNQLTPSNLGYFVFNATDLPAWKTFLQDIIGLQVGSRSSEQALVLRIDSQEQRYESPEEFNTVLRSFLKTGKI